jgi:hypothetical protein
MPVNELDDEELFLKTVTSHLPSDWSDERRDTYIQNVLGSWRKHREHSHEEELFMSKYLNTIKQNFKPLTPALYDFKQWPINENVLTMLKNDSIDSELVKQVWISSFIFLVREMNIYFDIDSINGGIYLSFYT